MLAEGSFGNVTKESQDNVEVAQRHIHLGKQADHIYALCVLCMSVTSFRCNSSRMISQTDLQTVNGNNGIAF